GDCRGARKHHRYRGRREVGRSPADERRQDERDCLYGRRDGRDHDRNAPAGGITDTDSDEAAAAWGVSDHSLSHRTVYAAAVHAPAVHTATVHAAAIHAAAVHAATLHAADRS